MGLEPLAQTKPPQIAQPIKVEPRCEWTVYECTQHGALRESDVGVRRNEPTLPRCMRCGFAVRQIRVTKSCCSASCQNFEGFNAPGA